MIILGRNQEAGSLRSCEKIGMRTGSADRNETSVPQSSIAATKTGPTRASAADQGVRPTNRRKAQKKRDKYYINAHALPTKWRRRFRLRTDFFTAYSDPAVLLT